MSLALATFLADNDPVVLIETYAHTLDRLTPEEQVTIYNTVIRALLQENRELREYADNLETELGRLEELVED